MANLTVTVDDDLLRKARLRAMEQGTSVNALLRDYLESYAGAAPARKKVVADLLQLSREAKSRKGRRSWTRDDLHRR
jgi:plasmid stability protein